MEGEVRMMRFNICNGEARFNLGKYQKGYCYGNEELNGERIAEAGREIAEEREKRERELKNGNNLKSGIRGI